MHCQLTCSHCPVTLCFSQPSISKIANRALATPHQLIRCTLLKNSVLAPNRVLAPNSVHVRVLPWPIMDDHRMWFCDTGSLFMECQPTNGEFGMSGPVLSCQARKFNITVFEKRAYCSDSGGQHAKSGGASTYSIWLKSPTLSHGRYHEAVHGEYVTFEASIPTKKICVCCLQYLVVAEFNVA